MLKKQRRMGNAGEAAAPGPTTGRGELMCNYMLDGTSLGQATGGRVK